MNETYVMWRLVLSSVEVSYLTNEVLTFVPVSKVTGFGKLIFVTCCGSSFKDKDNKFGHNLVFNHVKSLLNDKCLHCEAFPVDLFAPAELKGDPAAFMKVHLNNENFKGEIDSIYENFISRITNE